jgi:transposase
MYHVGIDISKFKHNCFIATEAGVKVKEFIFDNNKSGFIELMDSLQSLGNPTDIKIGFESTGHYGTNLKSYLSNLGYTYVELNAYLTHMFSKALSLRKTKTDKVDAKVISSMLGSVDYETLHTKFYHMNDLKELVRQRNVYLNSRSKELIKLTNLLDKTFPEFKPFFKNRLGASALFILKRFKTKARISKLSSSDYELIRSKTNGRITYPKFNGLKQIAKDSIGISSKVYDLLIQTVIHQIEHLTEILRSLDDEIILLFKKTDSKLLTIPGLGVITAATIYAEVGDFKNFSNPAKLVAFAGFDVRIVQSGTQEHYGKLVKHGSSLLRNAIWTYALPAVRFIPTFNDYYHKKKAQGKHHKVILSHICRKLIRMIYYIEYHNVSFDHSMSR